MLQFDAGMRVLDMVYTTDYSRKDFTPMLIFQPTQLPQTSLDHRMLNYICKPGSSKGM